MDKDEEAATRGLLRRVQARLKPGDRALMISNGGQGIPRVMLEVLGRPKAEPRHRGPRWKYPRLEPPPEIAYARLIKQRDAAGRVVALQEEILWGEPCEVWARLDPLFGPQMEQAVHSEARDSPQNSVKQDIQKLDVKEKKQLLEWLRQHVEEPAKTQ